MNRKVVCVIVKKWGGVGGVDESGCQRERGVVGVGGLAGSLGEKRVWLEPKM